MAHGLVAASSADAILPICVDARLSLQLHLVSTLQQLAGK